MNFDNVPMVAKCHSIRCTGQDPNAANVSGVVKAVSVSEMYCPDCGHALQWKRFRSKVGQRIRRARVFGGGARW